MAQTKESIPSAIERSQRRGVRNAAALMVASLTLMGHSGESQASEAKAGKAGTRATAEAVLDSEKHAALEKKKPKPLTKPEKLPGYNILVSPERRQQFQGSAVKIVARQKGSDSAWGLRCDGAMVTVPTDPNAQKGGPEQKLVLTAGHCFDNETGRTEGLEPDPSAPPAQNFINSSTYEFGVVDPLTPHSPREQLQPFADVTGISVNTKGQDWAMLMLAPKENLSGEATVGRTLDSMPAMPFSKEVARPVKGQEIALFGWSMVSQRPVVGTGRFLGRIKSENWAGKAVPMDVVGINSKTKQGDSCFYGASGSVAVGENYISGPLAARMNKTYDPAFIVEFFNNTPRSSIDFPFEVQQYRGWGKKWWENAEAKLGVSAAKFDTLCLFGVPEKNTATELYQGFSNFPKSNK